MGFTLTDATQDHHLQLFVVETQSMQVSPANRYKWLLYVNHTRKRQWINRGSRAENRLAPKKDYVVSLVAFLRHNLFRTSSS